MMSLRAAVGRHLTKSLRLGTFVIEANMNMKWFLGIWSFKGRSSPSQWWIESLLLVVWVVAWVALAIQAPSAVPVGVVAIGLVVYWELASDAKRWHDLNKSGWWTLVGLLPFGGIYVLCQLGFQKGTEGPNDYGLPPGGPVTIHGAPPRRGEVTLRFGSRSLATCRECGKAWGVDVGADKAREHSTYYGHDVMVETPTN